MQEFVIKDLIRLNDDGTDGEIRGIKGYTREDVTLVMVRRLNAKAMQISPTLPHVLSA